MTPVKFLISMLRNCSARISYLVPYLPYSVKDLQPVDRNIWEGGDGKLPKVQQHVLRPRMTYNCQHFPYIPTPRLTLGLTRITWELIFCLIHSAQTPENTSPPSTHPQPILVPLSLSLNQTYTHIYILVQGLLSTPCILYITHSVHT